MSSSLPIQVSAGLKVTSVGDNDQEKIQALRTLVVDCPELRALEKRLGRFNIFDVLKSAHNEIRHSNVLAWLLDPNESHGMRDLFLRRWLMRVFHDSEQEGASYLDPVEIDNAPFRSIEVRREWNRIDVLVEIVTQTDRQWIICIENKIWSWQAAGQLAEYRGRVERAFPNAAHRVYILLTVRGEQPDDDQWAACTYEPVTATLETCLAEDADALAEGPRMLIQNYLAILQERFMDNSEVAQLAQQIYATHRLALDTIFYHRPDNLLFLTEELKQRLKADAATLALRYKYTGKGWIGFVPLIWEVPANRISETWSTVLCEIKLTADKLRLKAFVDPTAPRDWRERLYYLAQQHSFPITIKKKKMPDGGFSFYRVRGGELGLEETEESDMSEKAEEVWNWVKAQISSQGFKNMATVVAEHLQSLPRSPGLAAHEDP